MLSFKRLNVLALSLLTSISAYSVPAKPGLHTIQNGDGSSINVRIVGDESFHYYLSDDNYLLTETPNGFVFATLDTEGKVVASAVAASDSSTRKKSDVQFLSTLNRQEILNRFISQSSENALNPVGSVRFAAKGKGPGLFENTTFPSTGEQKALIILVEFQDKPFTQSNSQDYFNRMANQKGFSDFGGTGSARDYYIENSNGQFSPTFDVFGPVKLSQNLSYYGGSSTSGRDIRPGEMVKEACQLLDSTVDFSQYDRDKDGFIDNVFIFYAGESEAGGGGTDAIWPHSWTLDKAIGETPVLDGVKLNRYACTNEWQKTRPDGVGTFLHEFSHVLGLPDLYPSGYTGGFTPGDWSVMDHGSYNNNGCTPPYFSAFERYALGWLEPQELTQPHSATLETINKNQAYIIKAGKDSEYFLFENRQKSGWDQYLPGHGMLVWHIDYAPNVWSANQVNNTPSHQYVDIEEADGKADESSRDGDTFPGTANITSFTDTTTPGMTTWNGYKINLPITNITEKDGIITFDVAGGRPVYPPVDLLPATNVTPEGFTLHWSEAPHAESYQISVYTETGDSKEYVAENLNTGKTTSRKFENLKPNTTYKYIVQVVDFVGPCQPSAVGEVKTLPMSFEYLTPTALEATEVSSSSFTANWNDVEGADNYFLNIYTKRALSPEVDTVDFTGGLEKLPAGWSTNVTGTYGTAGYSGQSAPSLRMASDDAYIASPSYSAPITGLTFWHRGSNVPTENRIAVDVLAGEDWKKLAEYPIENAAGGKTIEITDIPANSKSVKISFVRTNPSGVLALDDIKIYWNMKYEKIPVNRFDKFETGNVTTFRADGFEKNSEYYYTLVAGSKELRSKESNEIKVVTLNGTGVTELTNGIPYRLTGRTLELHSDSSKDVEIFDIHGRKLAVLNHTTSYTFPCGGIYIIKTTPDVVTKIIIP